MYYYGPMMNGTDWWIGWLMMLVWLSAFTVIALLAFRYLRGREAHSPSAANPLDIAKERYAKGEITKQQFDHLKKDLQ